MSVPIVGFALVSSGGHDPLDVALWPVPECQCHACTQSTPIRPGNARQFPQAEYDDPTTRIILDPNNGAGGGGLGGAGGGGGTVGINPNQCSITPGGNYIVTYQFSFNNSVVVGTGKIENWDGASPIPITLYTNHRGIPSLSVRVEGDCQACCITCSPDGKPSWTSHHYLGSEFQTNSTFLWKMPSKPNKGCECCT